MKKIMFILLCLFAVNVFAECQFNCQENNCDSKKENHLTNYYFSLDQIIIEKDQIYVNISDKIIPVYNLSKDQKGYYIQVWDDCDWCPFCNNFTWVQSHGCCANPPEKCPASCQNKFNKKT